MRSPRLTNAGSLCDLIIFVLIGSFALQSLLGLLGQEEFVKHSFYLSVNGLTEGKVWTLLSYGLFHDGPIHLLFNILGIHFIARYTENQISRSNFLLLVSSSLMVGGLFWIFFNNNNNILLGCSAFVLCSLTFFCLKRPNEPVTLLLLFVLPVSLKPKYILLATLLIEVYGLSQSEITGFGSVAHSSHLGGMFCGGLAYLYLIGRLSLPIRIKFYRSNSSKSFKKQPPSTAGGFNYKVNFADNTNFSKEVDRILDKINEHGFGALTDTEKTSLEKAKKQFGKD